MKRGVWLGFWGVILIVLLGLAALPVVWAPTVQAQDFTVPTRTPTPDAAARVPPPDDPPPPATDVPPEDTPMPGTPSPTPLPDTVTPGTVTPTPESVVAATATPVIAATEVPDDEGGVESTEPAGTPSPDGDVSPVESQPPSASDSGAAATPTPIPLAPETRQRIPVTVCGGALLLVVGLALLFLWRRKSA